MFSQCGTGKLTILTIGVFCQALKSSFGSCQAFGEYAEYEIADAQSVSTVSGSFFDLFVCTVILGFCVRAPAIKYLSIQFQKR